MQKLKSKSGITLIALVITIIVLLILAGISISMLSGDNSILSRAAQAKKVTGEEQIIEQIKIDLISAMAENKGSTVTNVQLKEILDKYFDEVPSDFSNLNETLTTKNGEFEIELSRILDGTVVNQLLVNGNNIFMPETDGNSETGDVKVGGWGIPLDGNLGLIVYFSIPEEKLNSGNEYLKYVVNGKDGKTTQLDIKQGTVKSITVGEKEYKSLQLSINPNQMAEPVKVKFYDNNGEDSEEYTNNLIACIKKFLINSDKYKDEKSQSLINYIKRMWNYGYYTQRLLSQTNNWTIGVDYVEIESPNMEPQDIEYVKTQVEGYNKQLNDQNSGFSKFTYAVDFYSGGIYFYAFIENRDTRKHKVLY